MEGSKYIITIFIAMTLATNINASYQTDIYNAYISNNMGKWEAIIDEMQSQETKSNEFMLELINYQYGYVAWCIGVEKTELAEKYLSLAENNLDKLDELSYKPSFVNSYKSAFYGFRIGLNVIKAPFLGPESVECAKLAMKLDDQNPYGYIQYGNAQYYMPAIFGGSKTVAIEYFKKAETIMERDKEKIKDDWNYLSLLTIIAKAYSETNNNELALFYCEKILKTEPNFLWVKNELYPQFLKNTKAI